MIKGRQFLKYRFHLFQPNTRHFFPKSGLWDSGFLSLSLYAFCSSLCKYQFPPLSIQLLRPTWLVCKDDLNCKEISIYRTTDIFCQTCTMRCASPSAERRVFMAVHTALWKEPTNSGITRNTVPFLISTIINCVDFFRSLLFLHL